MTSVMFGGLIILGVFILGMFIYIMGRLFGAGAMRSIIESLRNNKGDNADE